MRVGKTALRLAERLIDFYQLYLSTDQGLLGSVLPRGRVCRYSPTCSEYCRQALRKYGIIAGGLISLKRILRCHPWSRGGFDPLK